ncbi:MAG: hypothetical protein AAFS07_13440 [Pseudomonadota bacterium]
MRSFLIGFGVVVVIAAGVFFAANMQTPEDVTDGPAEQTGAAIDRAVEDLRDGAEAAGDALDDAAEDAGDAVEGVGN